MKFGRKPGKISVTIDEVALEQVKEFKHLESYLSKNYYTKKDTRVRIGIVKNFFTHLKPILTGEFRQATKKKAGQDPGV